MQDDSNHHALILEVLMQSPRGHKCIAGKTVSLLCENFVNITGVYLRGVRKVTAGSSRVAALYIKLLTAMG